MANPEELVQTPLHALHVEFGGRMVPFAGYEMPVHYPAGIMKEHAHTRAAAGLFDVSHMGQIALRGPDAAAALESLVPGDILGLGPGQMRYTQFTNAEGGILDDLMVTNAGDHVFVVVNAARKARDIALLREGLADRCTIEVLEDRALLALQGPAAAAVLGRHAPACADMLFMTAKELEIDGVPCFVSRCGYTGEDGYEISVSAAEAAGLARSLLAEPEVAPVGLGARDSLRLEAGLCLYGHDIDETTTPVEANLLWSIGKRRRTDGGFLGAEVIQRQIAEGAPRKRVGIRPNGRAPARERTEIMAADGNHLGAVTSGGFGPTVGGPVAMGYVQTDHAAVDTDVRLVVRGQARPGRVAALPFVKPNYKRG
ncbi:MAG: glycine cleavage system aminomethyltransferase GcvT [Alphaproteobacteria bacterium]|nr:glycine cleavage system aminomethyltransferase GcvT [Alphaproteobacteria bacterium]